MKVAPLEGIRVIAVEQFIAGPYCTMLLADAGAEVIKVERPGSGDPRREMGPKLKSESGEEMAWGFIEFNRNKKSICLDIQKEQGKAVLRDLVSRADVVVENMRPGVMDRLGLGYKDLSSVNPGIVYAAISGFGQMEGYQGPYSDWPAFDIVVEAMSGYMDLVGFEDRPPISAIYGLADLAAGLSAVQGILLALLSRQKTGKGQFVDISMLDSMVALNERALTIYSFTGSSPVRGKETLFGPRGAFRAKDGYVALNVPTDYMWGRLAAAIGREELVEDPRCKDGRSRAANNESFLRPIIEEWLKDKTRMEAVKKLIEGGVPAGPVHTAEDVHRCPHVAARRMLVEIEDPIARGHKVVRSPVRLSDAPEVRAATVPRLGQHTEEVLSGILGYSSGKIEELRQQGVI